LIKRKQEELKQDYLIIIQRAVVVWFQILIDDST